MNLNGLRLISYRVRRGAVLLQDVKSLTTRGLNAQKVTPLTFHSYRSFDKKSIFSSSITGTRCYGDTCSAVSKFEKSCIEPRYLATYEEIADLPKHPEKLLIDVREPAELAATGVIPTSINIPLNSVGDELKISPDKFKAKYGRQKPGVDDPIIFTCRSGVRAGVAADEADKLGFKNVKNYIGSWLEYAEKNGLQQE